MIKRISIFLISLLCILLAIVIYLSTIGVETNSFNNVIKEKLKNYNQSLNLNFSKVKLLLDVKSLNLKIKFIKPRIESEGNKIIFLNVSSIISLKSYLKDEFFIKSIKIQTNETKLNEFINFIRSIYPSPFVFILKKTIKDGTIQGETELFFNKKGDLNENYEFLGSIFNLDIKILHNHKIKKIDYKITKDLFEFKSKDFELYDQKFQIAKINIKKNKRDLNFLIDSKTTSKINSIEKFLDNFNYKLSTDNFNFSNINLSLSNKINFKLKNFFKLKDLKIKGSGHVNEITIKSDNFQKYKKNFKINKNIQFKNHKIKYDYSNNKFKLDTLGKFNLKDKLENFKAQIKIDFKNNLKEFNADFGLDGAEINLKNLNYYKPADRKSKIKINVVIEKNNKILKKLKFEEQKNNIEITNLKLNNKNQISDFKKILISTFKNKSVNNNFEIIKKNKKINILGTKYDATFFFKNLNSGNKLNIFNKNFNGDINFKIKEIINNEEDTMFDFNGSGKIKFGKFYKLNAKSNFSNTDILEIDLTTNNSNLKNLFIYSDRAKPFVNSFNFIKGFSEGKLEYISYYDDKSSKSNLKIYDFKVNNVPVLAKLLSLASLQGIADILTGEGIRFKEFDLDFESKDKLVTINEMYAIGPAISILMNGYIKKNELISLRGTLVPATTINKAIGTIPLIGKLLVGNKIGEGVFGVSFKIKGAPKNLKTTVNPIKTLTPRFITRTLEKIKKN